MQSIADIVQDRAVSPVIGTVLLTAIVVVLAAMTAGMLLGFNERLQEPVPAEGFDTEYNPAGSGNTDNRPFVNITHDGGEELESENIIIQDDSGNTIAWNDVWTGGPVVKPGEYVHIDGFGSDKALDPICEKGQSYEVIIRRDDGSGSVINEWTAPTPPDLPDDAAKNRGDGIPTWC